MPELNLDAWAIMARLKGRQLAAERVRLLLDEADRRERKLVMNIVDIGEVFYLSVKATDLATANQFSKTCAPALPPSRPVTELVLRAANLKARHQISYADAFAVATAIGRNSPLVNGDPSK